MVLFSPFIRTFALPDGPRVRLRLARRSDADAARALLERRGVAASALEIRRLLTYDPSQRIVLCAVAPIDGAEALVGVGAIDLAHGADPDTLVVDGRVATGLTRLLGEALVERARSHGRRVA